MRIFLVLLANVYLERSVFQSLLLQIGKCKASTVVSLALDSLHFSGRNGKIANITQQGHLCGCDQPCPLAPCLHFTSFSLVTQVSSSGRCWCCCPNTNILCLSEHPQQLLSVDECLCFNKGDRSLRIPLKFGCHCLRTHSYPCRGIVTAPKSLKTWEKSNQETRACFSKSALSYKQTLWHCLLITGVTFHITHV